MHVHEITKMNYQKEVTEEEKIVLLDFWAPWCNPCRMVSPLVDEIANERQDVKVCKVNIDEEPEIARQFKIYSIPTLAVLKEGKIIQSSSGFKPKNAILKMLEL